MRKIFLFLMLTSVSFASNPSWMDSFDDEVSQYRYGSGQPSLATLRTNKIGNCVAFASCAAEHVLRARGYECYFVDITNNKEGHRFLYVVRPEVTKIVKRKIDGRVRTFIDLDSPESYWVVSVKTRYQVDSLQDALEKMGKNGHFIARTVQVKPEDTLGQVSEFLRVEGTPLVFIDDSERRDEEPRQTGISIPYSNLLNQDMLNFDNRVHQNYFRYH